MALPCFSLASSRQSAIRPQFKRDLTITSGQLSQALTPVKVAVALEALASIAFHSRGNMQYELCDDQ